MTDIDTKVEKNSSGTFHYKNGECHRDNDLPAVIYDNGTKAWYQNGKCHRDNDLPAVVHADGDKEWWQNGKRIK